MRDEYLRKRAQPCERLPWNGARLHSSRSVSVHVRLRMRVCAGRRHSLCSASPPLRLMRVLVVLLAPRWRHCSSTAPSTTPRAVTAPALLQCVVLAASAEAPGCCMTRPAGVSSAPTLP